MKSSSSDKRSRKPTPLSLLFVLITTATLASTGVFGLFPSNPITQQYRTVIAQHVAPEFLAPVNGFLGALGMLPIPEDQYTSYRENMLVLDPGGWLLELFGVTAPPLYGPESPIVILDPGGALLKLFGANVDSLPESPVPLDPASSLFQQIGLTLPPEFPNNPSDPAGALLTFLIPGYDPNVAADTILDPGAVLIAWIVPGFQPPPIGGSGNPPPDPGGQLLSLFVSPQLLEASDNSLKPGEVIVGWLFPAESAPSTTLTFTSTPTASSTPAGTPTLTFSATPMATATYTSTSTTTASYTPTRTPTRASSLPIIIYPTATPSATLPPTSTPTPTATATATPPIVNSLADPGNGVCDASECTLREAIAVVRPSDTITFSSALSGGTITLATAELAITKNLIIDGSALASRITISGNNARRVFNISSCCTVTLKNLIIANGYANGVRGGGISNDGVLIVMDSLFSGNTAANQWGGAIANQGTLTVTNSTFSGNTATNGDGAAIDSSGSLTVTNSTFNGNSVNPGAGGAIRNNATATIVNSTFSGNSAVSFWGGAIHNAEFAGVTLTVINSTFSGNSASSGGGGIYNRNATAGSLNLINTIITGSTTGGDCVTQSILGGTSKNNLITNTGANACNLSNGVNGNIIGSGPNLGALANNGGPTQTFALLAGSPAIDAGDDATCAAAPVNNRDQRGLTRPQGAHCDIGAFEVVLYTVTFNANGGSGTMAPQSGSGPAALNANTFIRAGCTFASWNTAANGSGTAYADSATYNFSADTTLYARWTCPSLVTTNADSGAGSLRQAIADTASGGTITFDSSLSGGTITLTSAELAIAKNLTIDGSSLTAAVTISGGNVLRVFNVTGAYTVTLRNLIISNGSATQGGGIYNSGTLTVTGCTFSGNSASVDGGGIFNNGYSPNIAVLNVTNSTFSGNTATYGGGGIAQIAAGGSVTLSVTNSTFVNNSANYGGGIHNDSGTVTVTNSTFSGNQANLYAGGIENYSSASTLNIANTIIANSIGTASDCYNNGGTIGTNANNLVKDGSCSASLSGDPLLATLAYNGGSTMNMALLAGSPAIDAGNDSYCPSTDQRGATRPQGLHCDIGAFESSFSPAGHIISSFSLNGGGNTVTVAGGSLVTVDYIYQVWGDSSTCPGCNYQLVWGLDNNWQYCSAWTSPSPGDYPGLSGMGSQFTINAPATTGTYTVYSFSGQYADCTAAIAAYTSAGGSAQGTLSVP